MPLVTASIGLPIELWDKCRKYHINRSEISRKAIAKEVERIEKELGIARKANTQNTNPKEGDQIVSS